MQFTNEKVLGSDEPIGLSKLDKTLANNSIGGGYKDGEEHDDVVKSATAEFSAKDLKPAQTGIKAKEVVGIALDMLLDGKVGGDLGAIASKDNYIMDGHHRWAATYIIDPNAQLKVTVMDLPGQELITALNVITKGKLGIDAGNPEEGDIRSLNSHTLEPIIDSYIEKGKLGNWPLSADEVKQALANVPGAKNYMQGKEILLKNSNSLPKDIMPNAPRRVDMPIIAPKDVNMAKSYMAKGAVDLKQPYSDKVAASLEESIDGILEEWAYRCPKGYPTVVDGVFTERDEVIILNQLLEERGFEMLTVQKEVATLNNKAFQLTESATDDKENTVCVVIDILNLHQASGAQELLVNHFNYIKSKGYIPTNKQYKDFKANKAKLRNLNLEAISSSQFNKYSKNVSSALVLLGLGKSEVVDTKVALNSISTGLMIFDDIAKRKPINIFRSVEFEAIRKKATDIYKAETNQDLKPDNWCPGDIYVSFGNPTLTALRADSLVLETKGKLPLNKLFSIKPTTKTFTAISLKQQDAQAGKATTFTKNVFQTNIKLDSKPIDYLEGKNTDKQQLNLLKTIKRYEAYVAKATTAEQKQPATKILDKGLDVLRYAGKINSREKSLKRKELTPYFKGSVMDFNPKSKDTLQFMKLVSLVAKNSKRTAGDNINDLEKKFIQARKNFLGALKASNVNIKTVTKSETLFKEMQNRLKQDAPTYIVQKTATYDFFSNIFDDWTNKTKGSLKPHFQTLSKVANPFVAITMFAIAEAGISPPFIKAIGSERTANGAHMDIFDHNYIINNTTSAKEVSITDNPTAAGFDARFTIDFKTKKYTIKLSFRFSGTEIRVEVQELTKL